jgi:hypothetical protein
MARKLEPNLSYQFSIFSREQEHKQKAAAGSSGEQVRVGQALVCCRRFSGFGHCCFTLSACCPAFNAPYPLPSSITLLVLVPHPIGNGLGVVCRVPKELPFPAGVPQGSA